MPKIGLPRGDQLAQHRHGIFAGRRRIARAVRQEDAVGLVAQDVLGRRGRRHHGDPAAMRGQHAQDVALGAVIDGDDVKARLRLPAVAASRAARRSRPSRRSGGR